MAKSLDQITLGWIEEQLDKELIMRGGLSEESKETFRWGFRSCVARLSAELSKNEVPF